MVRTLALCALLLTSGTCQAGEGPAGALQEGTYVYPLLEAHPGSLLNSALWKDRRAAGHHLQASNLTELEARLLDRSEIFTCLGARLALLWEAPLSVGDTIESINWIKRASTRDMMAHYTKNHFLPTPAYTGRVEKIGNAGILLKDLKASDTGIYSVKVVIKEAKGNYSIWERAVYGHVSEKPATNDDSIHIFHDSVAEYSNDTDEYFLVLRCGVFSSLMPPEPEAIWSTPSGHILPSMLYENGSFVLKVPIPLMEGPYTCHVPGCLFNHTDHATVMLDQTVAQVAILDIRQTHLEAQHEVLEKKNMNVSLKYEDVAHEFESLENEQDELKDRYEDFEKASKNPKRFMILMRMVQALQAKDVNLTDEIADLMEKDKDLELRLKNVEDMTKTLSQNFKAMERKQQYLESEHRDFDQMNKDLETKYESLDQKNRDLEEKYQEVNDTVRQLQQVSEALQKRTRELETTNTNLESTCTDAKRKGTELENKYNDLVKADRDLEAKYRGVAEKSKELETQSADLRKQDEDLERKEELLENKYTDMQQKTGDLRNKYDTLKTKNEQLEQKDEQLESSYRDVVAKTQELQRKCSAVDEKAKDLETKYDDLESKNEGLKDRVKDLEPRLTSIEKEQAAAKNTNASTVAFSARTSQLQRIYQHERIHFNVVQYNMGGGYDAFVGEFKAPKNGTYVLYCQTSSKFHAQGHFQIMVRGSQVCVAMVYRGLNQGSCLATVYMVEGEKAWVTPYHDGFLYDRFSTSFSGFLVNP